MRHVTSHVVQRNRLIHLPSAWGSLGVAQILMKAGFVGKAALIGPQSKDYIRWQTSTSAQTHASTAENWQPLSNTLRDATINQPRPYQAPRDDDRDAALRQDGPKSDSESDDIHVARSSKGSRSSITPPGTVQSAGSYRRKANCIRSGTDPRRD
jgi:hypothetical protein